MILTEKQTLRATMRGVLSAFAGRGEASRVIARRLRELPAWHEAEVIYGFAPLRSEPEWRQEDSALGKQIAYPRIVGDAMLFYVAEEFRPGSLGILEPVGETLAPPADLIIVPGVAFDPQRHRLGRGKGHYDRWLAERGSAQAIGVCFECQIVPAVPREAHDVQLDGVVTEERVC